MNEHIGKFQELGLAIEAERGTAQSEPTKSLKKIEANFYKNTEKAEDESTVATVADVQGLRKTQEQYEGDISMNLHADTIGYLLENILGVSNSTELVSGAYKHEFELLESIKRPTLTAFLKDGGVNQEKVAGCVVNTLSISVEMDSHVSADFNLMGTKGEADSSTFSYTKEYDFIGKDLTVVIGDSKAELDNGGETIQVKSASLEIDTGAQFDFVSDGEYTPHDVFQGNLSIEGTLTLNYDGDTFKDLNENDTSKFVRIKIEGDEVLPGSNKPKLEFNLYEVYVSDWSRTSSRDEVITQEVSIKAAYNQDEGTIGAAEVVNATEDYDAVVS